MEVHYDKEEDVPGIQLKSRKHWKGVEVGDHFVLDLAKDGEIVGIEILGVKDALKEAAPLVVSKASRRKP
jgi:uncharacterized protein YuzE